MTPLPAAEFAWLHGQLDSLGHTLTELARGVREGYVQGFALRALFHRTGRLAAEVERVARDAGMDIDREPAQSPRRCPGRRPKSS
jgi:hypothetical protein